MRKFKYIVAMATFLAIAGCSEVQLPEPSQLEPGQLVFVVRSEPDCITKAAIEGGNAITFTSGDTISVFDKNNNNCVFTQSGQIGTDGSTAFTGKIGAVSDTYLSLYPYQATAGSDGTYIGNENCPVIIPSEQKAVAGSFDSKAFISVGKSQKDSGIVHSISFQCACSLVKFTIPESADDLTLEKAVLSVQNGYLSGGVILNSDGTKKQNVGTGLKSIVLTGTMKAGESYYFCTDVGEISGISLSLYHYPSNDKPLVEKKSDKQVNLVRNTVLDLGEIEITPPEMETKWYGKGTESDPYQISTVENLRDMLESLAETSTYRGCHFRLTDNIDCDNDTLIADNKKVEFCGVFDGNNKTISNYIPSTVRWYDQNSYQLRGLFHKVYRATFKNLTLRPSSVIKACFETYNDFSPFIAEVAAASENIPTIIDGCRLEGDVEIQYNLYEWGNLWMGGFVGDNGSDDLRIVNCINAANFTFSEYECEWEYDGGYTQTRSIEENGFYRIGGFIGQMYCGGKSSTTSFDRCRNNGNITFDIHKKGIQIQSGGFIGYGDWAFLYPSTLSFTNCVNSGNIDIKPGDECGCVYATGFIAYDQIDGYNEKRDKHLADPRFYNCLNKGDICASGKDSHAAGFAHFNARNPVKETENNTQFAICINIGEIKATSPELLAPQQAAISSGYGTCIWSWWQEDNPQSPALPCTLSGKSDKCYCYTTINADTPNNRKNGSDGAGGQEIVLDVTNSQWTNQQWKDNTVQWVGSSSDGSLDLNF